MKAINKTKDVTLVLDVKIASNPLSRGIGLLLHSTLPEEEGLLIVPCKSIHSFLMRFEFDALFLDRDGKVVHLVKRVKPSKITRHIWEAYQVLEISAGIIENTNTETGDIIVFE